jgi:phosphate transport system substrate-binding protein
MKNVPAFVPLLLSATVALAIQSCSTAQTSSTNEQKLVLTGSSTVAPLVAEIAKRYEAENAGVRIDVQSGGSSRGIADVREGVADIGMVSRALSPEESDLQAFEIAKDGVSLIVNAANPVTELSDAQVVSLYSKEITNWQAVGGPDAPITLVSKAEGRSTLELFAKYFALDTQAIKADVIIGENEQAIKTVAGNPHAIGYVSIGSAEYDAGEGASIKLLPVNGVEASSENVSNQTFPISRPLNLVTQTTPTRLQTAFIEFAQSSAVTDIVREQYFVPVAQ